MTSATFQPGRPVRFASAAPQQNRVTANENAADANADCGCTDTCNCYVKRGILYGLIISAPLWVTLGGSVGLAYWVMR